MSAESSPTVRECDTINARVRTSYVAPDRVNRAGGTW